VERKQAADDRRKIIVRITNVGVKMVAKMRKEIAQNISTIMTDMDAEETETVEGAKRVLDIKK